MDDLKVSHLEPVIVTKMENWMKNTSECLLFDGSGEMKLAREKIHKYLGMTLDFWTDGEVKVTMIKYVTEIVTLFLKH